MSTFSVSLLGSSGPNEMLVGLSREEVCTRLEMSFVLESDETMMYRLFASNRRYAGWIRGDKIEIQPLWRNRRFRPTLVGVLTEEHDGATRIRFEIEMDSMVLLMWIVPLLVLAPVVGAIFLLANEPITYFPFWCLAPVLVVLGAIANSLLARHESKKLLEFFETLFRDERIYAH